MGEILKVYKSGKLPRSFHVIPLMEYWEALLEITKPEEWSPHAFYEAVRVFTSQSESERTIKFFSAYLLPRVNKDIATTKKLNYHLYR